MTDQKIIQGFLKGGSKEYNQVREWIAAMVRSRLWDNRVTPEDVVADTLIKLLLNLRKKSFRVESSLKTYVQRITLNTLVDGTRRRKRLVPIADENTLSDASTPLTKIEHDEELELMDRALSMLPEACRKLFEMVLQEQVTYVEIARRIGSSEGAIKTRISRCRQKISEIMRQMT